MKTPRLVIPVVVAALAFAAALLTTNLVSASSGQAAQVAVATVSPR